MKRPMLFAAASLVALIMLAAVETIMGIPAAHADVGSACLDAIDGAHLIHQREGRSQDYYDLVFDAVDGCSIDANSLEREESHRLAQECLDKASDEDEDMACELEGYDLLLSNL